MGNGDREILIAVGIVLIIVGIFGKTFYAANGIRVSDKQLPTWMGRLFFWVVGGMMILGGLNALFPPH
jgi:hypothetical protein